MRRYKVTLRNSRVSASGLHEKIAARMTVTAFCSYVQRAQLAQEPSG